MLGLILNEVAIIDAWLDEYVSQEYKDQPLAQDWARVAKVTEEAGEAVNELILFTGQNPRKQRTTDIRPLLDELADTAITAILAMQHFTKDQKYTGNVLTDKVQAIGRRAAQHKMRQSSERVQPGRMATEAKDAWLGLNQRLP